MKPKANQIASHNGKALQYISIYDDIFFPLPAHVRHTMDSTLMASTVNEEGDQRLQMKEAQLLSLSFLLLWKKTGFQQ